MRHLTVYRYSKPVGLGEHRMMFRPRESHDLKLLKEKLAIAPEPATLRWLHDMFDNSVAIAKFDGTTSELRFDSTITLEHLETALPDYPLEEYARTYPFCYHPDELPDLARGLLRHYPSDDVVRWASQFPESSGTTGTMDLLRSISAAIHKEFRYKRRTEKGTQRPHETLTSRQGSCRDFALLMMEAARYLGLAARFVSGYIYIPDKNTRAAASAGALTGGGSTHAWMQAYLPGAGWVDFDPTNGIIGNRNLIRVAVAWDPKHVLPLWGTYVGSPSSFQGMDVTVRVTEGTTS